MNDLWNLSADSLKEILGAARAVEIEKSRPAVTE
jgi:hypothetical protein